MMDADRAPPRRLSCRAFEWQGATRVPTCILLVPCRSDTPGPGVACQWRGYTSSSSPAGGLPIGQVGFGPCGMMDRTLYNPRYETIT
jgi:hypothetical protein